MRRVWGDVYIVVEIFSWRSKHIQVSSPSHKQIVQIIILSLMDESVLLFQLMPSFFVKEAG